MCSIVSFYSGSLLYLLGMVVHSEQVVQRSRQDEGPEDKSLRHFGAISETESSLSLWLQHRSFSILFKIKR